MTQKRKSDASSVERELLGIFVAFMPLALGYFFAEGMPARSRHPIHWIVAGAAGLLCYVSTVLVYLLLHKNRKP